MVLVQLVFLAEIMFEGGAEPKTNSICVPFSVHILAQNNGEKASVQLTQ